MAEQISYFEAAWSVIKHPIDSLSGIVGHYSGNEPGGVNSISDDISNSYWQFVSGKPLTADQLKDIETQAYNATLKAGGTIVDAQRTAQQVESFYINTYGQPDESTAAFISKLSTILTVVTIVGVGVLALLLLREIRGLKS